MSSLVNSFHVLEGPPLMSLAEWGLRISESPADLAHNCWLAGLAGDGGGLGFKVEAWALAGLASWANPSIFNTAIKDTSW